MNQLLILFFLAVCSLVKAARLTVENDGPAVVGYPITFNATYDGVGDYIFVFQDKHDLSKVKEVYSRKTALATFVYYSIPEASEMVVSVYFQIFGARAWFETSLSNSFIISDYLTTRIEISQENLTSQSLSKSIVSTGDPANISVSVHDPNGLFNNYTKSYLWKINETSIGDDKSDMIPYNFTNPVSYNISVTVRAIGTYKGAERTIVGSVGKSVVAKNPIKLIKDSGLYFSYRKFQLNISCDGSGPFSFCKNFFNKDPTNVTCGKPQIESDTCSFGVQRFFNVPGTYYLKYSLQNDVSFETKVVKLDVIEDKKQTQLTFVVIPVVCSLLAIVILMFGVTYHVQQRQRFTTEVAAFDFRDDQELSEMTFWERLKGSFADAFQASFLSPLIRRQHDAPQLPRDSDLLNDEDEGLGPSQEFS